MHSDIHILCAVLCTTHTSSTHITLGHAATPPNNNCTECPNINITLARLIYKLPDDGRRPKHVAAISFYVINQGVNKCASVGK